LEYFGRCHKYKNVPNLTTHPSTTYVPTLYCSILYYTLKIVWCFIVELYIYIIFVEKYDNNTTQYITEKEMYSSTYIKLLLCCCISCSTIVCSMLTISSSIRIMLSTPETSYSGGGCSISKKNKQKKILHFYLFINKQTNTQILL